MKRGIQFSVKYRPLSIIAIAGGTRDIILGLGFIWGWGEITRTLIYRNYNELAPGYSGLVAGAMMVLSGIVVCWGAYKGDRRHMTRALNVQGFLWLFSTLMYILNGYFVLAAIFGVFFSFPAAFIAFHVKLFAPLDERIADMLKNNEEEVG